MKRRSRADAGPHPLDDLALGVDRPRGGPRLAHAPADGGEEVLVPFERGERPLDGREVVLARRVCERERQRLAAGEHRGALFELRDGAPGNLERARGLRRPHPDRAALLLGKSALGREPAPHRLERLAAGLALPLPCRKGRGLRGAHIVAPPLLADVGEDVAPAA